MKRKYAAIALGLTLALSSTAAFAEESTEAAVTPEAATEAADESALDANEENTETFLGQITEITENSIKIKNSRLVPVSDTEDAEIAAENASADAADNTEDDAENPSENADETAENTDDTIENTDDTAADAQNAENAEASTDGAESTGEADNVSLNAVLELSPDQTTTIDYSEATSFKLLTDQYTLTITDNGLTDIPADEVAEATANEDTEATTSEDAKATADEDTEATTDENTEATADEDTEDPTDDNAEAATDEAAKTTPAEQDMASLIPADAITEVITAADLQEGDVIYAVLNDDGTAAEITVLAKGDTIAAVYGEADAQ